MDYWRVAAGESGTAGPRPTIPAPTEGRKSGALIAAGLAGMIAAGIGTAAMVVGNPKPDRPLIANTLPSRGPDDFVIERFFRQARDPYAAFSFVSQGTLRQTDPEETEILMTEAVLVHGDDWISQGTYASDGQSVEQSFAVVDGRYFERKAADAEWVSGELSGDDRPGSPFFRIATVGEIDYVASETTGGTTLHHLVVTKWLGGNGRDFRLVGFDGITQRENRFDIWVTDGGTPVRAYGVSTFTLSQGSDTYAFATDVTLTFDDWGEVEAIEPPA